MKRPIKSIWIHFSGGEFYPAECYLAIHRGEGEQETVRFATPSPRWWARLSYLLSTQGRLRLPVCQSSVIWRPS